uniref:Uncharacterized protein n=1 Tax=Fusarium oxysporum (strain Fo5176) TaxID=660025 RepID=A0A0D2Y6A7_FUSOF
MHQILMTKPCGQNQGCFVLVISDVDICAVVEEQLYHGCEALAGCRNEDTPVGRTVWYLETVFKKALHELVATEPQYFPDDEEIALQINMMVIEKSGYLFVITVDCICPRSLRLVLGIIPFLQPYGPNVRHKDPFFPEGAKPRDHAKISRHMN